MSPRVKLARRQENTVLPIPTYPKYYETSIYESNKTEYLPLIIEDML
jgi:hypothetical protein